MHALRGSRVPEAKTIAPKPLQQVVELLPEGKVPGNFAADFVRIFRPEIEQRFLTAKASAESK